MVPNPPRQRERRPWFPCHPTLFASPTVLHDLGLEAFGAYWVLICDQWREHGLPNDELKLARRVGLSRTKFRRLWNAGLAEHFPLAPDGRLRHPELERVRASQDKQSASQTLKAAYRWALQRRDVPPATTFEEFVASRRKPKT